MPQAKPFVPLTVERGLGITITPGVLPTRLVAGPAKYSEPQEGWWVNYGHGRGAQWFATEAEALHEIDVYTDKLVARLSRDLSLTIKLKRWLEQRREDI